ncbi:hypothetical protein I316_03124 [Kwoniella heveanensis BCC8398]|uniref:NAD(P)-binding domain-containing protein n=1 Tax=Kwoniella heveanensis BCC8398 TaxID=1296120 RepID=A0A1B9GVL8_9TREE|nr:hypothetical protein I316_03124 [Kwoniella heveanensis BCC8398]
MSENILVLGSTGATGLEFLRETLPLSDGPRLTLLVRSRSKLPQDLISQSASKVRIVEGGLSDEAKLDEAMEGVTTVISFLGAYPAFSYLVTRAKPTPIANSFPLIKRVMKKHGVKRLLALSTPSHSIPGEKYNFAQWFTTQIFPPYLMPQGDAEMKAIAEHSADDDFDYTIFRVPHLTNGPADLKVYAGFYGPDFKGSQSLSRASLARWAYQEVVNKQWIRQQPALGNY